MAIQGNNRSNVVQKLNITRSKVEHFLKADRTLADNDERLVSSIWHLEVTKLGRDPKKITAEDFLRLYASGELTSADVITRARRKVEEEVPELRGITWEERQGLKEKTVREKINQPVIEAPKGQGRMSI
jgi:hypothetical protein